MMFVLKEEGQLLDTISVANEFMSANSQSISYFGRF
jgi:hypothetical protein